jgi:hypothetical protein
VLTVYVPAPPVPVKNAVIVVLAVTPVPLKTIPIAKTPVTVPPTVSVVVDILDADPDALDSNASYTS